MCVETSGKCSGKKKITLNNRMPTQVENNNDEVDVFCAHTINIYMKQGTSKTVRGETLFFSEIP